MASEERAEWRRGHGGHFLIPAGLFIGLGIGLLAGYPGPGILIGLGCGFIASAFAWQRAGEPETPTPGSASAPGPTRWVGPRWIHLVIGIFIIIIGLGIVWAPPQFWVYVVAVFLVVLGIWLAARGFYRNW